MSDCQWCSDGYADSPGQPVFCDCVDGERQKARAAGVNIDKITRDERDRDYRG